MDKNDRTAIWYVIRLADNDWWLEKVDKAPGGLPIYRCRMCGRRDIYRTNFPHFDHCLVGQAQTFIDNQHDYGG